MEQLPGNKNERFPDLYFLRIYVDGRPVDIDITKEHEISQSLNPSILRLTGYVPDDLIDDYNQEVLSLKVTRRCFKQNLFLCIKIWILFYQSAILLHRRNIYGVWIKKEK